MTVCKQQLTFKMFFSVLQNRLQWGRSNLVDPAEWPKIGLLNRDSGSILSVFPRKNSKTESSLNFLQSGPRKFTKSDFSGLAPIRRALSSLFVFYSLLVSLVLGGKISKKTWKRCERKKNSGKCKNMFQKR